VAAQVRRDQLEAGRRLREDVPPVRAAPHPAVQPQQWLALTVRVVVERDAVDAEEHGAIIGTVQRDG